MTEKHNLFLNINLNISITPETSVIADYDFKRNIACIEVHGGVRATVTIRLEDMDTIDFIRILKNLKCSQKVTGKKEYMDFLTRNPLFKVLKPSEVVTRMILNQGTAKEITTGKAATPENAAETETAETWLRNQNRNMLRAALTNLVKDNLIFISPHSEYTIHAADENTAMEYLDNVPYTITRFTDYPKAVFKYDNQTGRNRITGILYKGTYVMPDGTSKEGCIFCCEQESIGVQAVEAVTDYIKCTSVTGKQGKGCSR